VKSTSVGVVSQNTAGFEIRDEHGWEEFEGGRCAAGRGPRLAILDLKDKSLVAR
jgi:hypothetical protein